MFLFTLGYHADIDPPPPPIIRCYACRHKFFVRHTYQTAVLSSSELHLSLRPFSEAIFVSRLLSSTDSSLLSYYGLKIANYVHKNKQIRETSLISKIKAKEGLHYCFASTSSVMSKIVAHLYTEQKKKGNTL